MMDQQESINCWLEWCEKKVNCEVRYLDNRCEVKYQFLRCSPWI